jgi:hypothetical protein
MMGCRSTRHLWVCSGVEGSCGYPDKRRCQTDTRPKVARMSFWIGEFDVVGSLQVNDCR